MTGEAPLESERHKTILESIIRQYIASAAPIGSRTLSRSTDLHLSPASIRNIMADLEEMGFIMQPHTSAGRVPTDKGYRYYVDVLMQVQRITQEEQERIRREYESRELEVSAVLRQTTRLITALTRKPSLISVPRRDEAALRHLELVAMTPTKLLTVAVFANGVVENVPLDLEQPVTEAAAEQAQAVLNRAGRGRRLSELAGALAPLAADGALAEPARRLAELVAQRLPRLVRREDESVLVDGASMLLDEPDFRDLRSVKDLLRTLENRAALAELLQRELTDERAGVRIGSENAVTDLRDCSVVTASYSIGDLPAGVLGIVGPTRIEYPKMIAILDYVAYVVSDVLSAARGGNGR
ncbi:MAG TPA: heat-inducible transcriptional repressor HrcA [bacterium]|nr:heat-inducible transcriptional repressor HrcA [bacterium]